MTTKNKYIRTKPELIILCEKAIATYGELVKIPVAKLDGQNKAMFCGPIPVILNQLLFIRLPRNYNNPSGIQRTYKEIKIQEIIDVAKSNTSTFPGAVIANILRNDFINISQIGPNVKAYELEINLSQLLIAIEEAEADKNEILLDETKCKIGYLIDSHHRSEGLYGAQKLFMDLNTTFYMDLPKRDMAGVFVLVNDKQEKPNPTHTLAMKDLSNLLEGDEQLAFNIMEELNDRQESVFFNRIKMFDGKLPKNEIPKYISGKSMHTFIEKKIITALPSKQLTHEEKITTIMYYFEAWKNVFRDAWNDNKKHVLVKAMGINVMSNLFGEIYQTAQLISGSNTPNSVDFYSIIQNVFGDLTILIGSKEDGKAYKLDWTSSNFGQFSNGKGINLLTVLLKQLVVDKRAEILASK